MRQRGEGSWVLRVYLGRDPLTGEKRWKYKTFKGGKREAQRALAAMVAMANIPVPHRQDCLRWRSVNSQAHPRRRNR
jgi:hypothetical protein